MAPAADGHERDVRSALAESDGELIRRIAEGDRAAFDTLYGRYVRPVYGLALCRLRDHEEARAATQRAFLEIWRSAPTYDAERADGPRWLFTVAESAIVPEVAPQEPGGETTAEDGWPAFRIHAAVGGLPEQERVALELAYWDGRSQNEIAEQLGLPLDAVEARTRSALSRLATTLEELR